VHLRMGGVTSCAVRRSASPRQIRRDELTVGEPDPSPSSIEGVLLTCCASELAAQVLVVGHHGSRTTSRRAFLDAVGASVFVVSSGPKKYSGVVLPDADVIAELEARGQVFRTDVNDAACAANAAKIGPDADGAARRLRQHPGAPWRYAACAGVGVPGC
jgi:hypothetical protein